MKPKSQDLTFIKLDKEEQLPYELLLLADPSKEMVDNYIKHSEIFVAKLNGEIIGIIVLFPLTADQIEIINMAVYPNFQGQGIGSYMIETALEMLAQKNLKSVCIGTANSSLAQLYLYQKLGFEITELKKDFFIDNYTEPIFENGIQAKHLILLTKDIEQNKKLK